ncbi:armadillo-type protein [Protomyces lactucae-debilis]|uniref:Exportin-T n=1 Tax=Protomyces lactucae-debilis TaxID=2754530 RepID=A0A1Y2F994_PROLT|nr:armadillo-type protein [Protomyces lactucae-debilis]ORY79465.1 armadillo-type protein [Protomyces lactucae-debilis]
MEDDLERAVEIALSQTSDSHVRGQAMAFCEQVKAANNGWQTCLQLFMQGSKRRSDNARFFALQVIDDALRYRAMELGEGTLNQMRLALSKWIAEAVGETGSPDPPFLRNKLAEIYALLFVHLYPTTWTTFFKECTVLMFGSEQVQSTSNARAVDFFFRVCVAIDSEIADVLIVRSQEEAARSVLIKDEIRDRDMTKLPPIWFALFAQYQESDKGIVTLGLKVVAAWVSWMDISLIVNEPFMTFLFGLLRDASLRNPACEALVGIVSKKMNVNDKLQLISMLNLPNVMNSLESDMENDPDFAENVAKLTNVQCVELSRALSQNKLPAETANVTSMMIFSLVPTVLRFLANEYDEISAAVFPAVNDIITMMRKVGVKDTEPRRILTSLLQAVVLKMKYDESSEWGDEQDAVEDAEFLELRSKLRTFQDMILAFDYELYLTTVNDLVMSTFNNPQEQDWRQLELAMYELYLFGETLRTGTKDPAVREVAAAQLDRMLMRMMQADVSIYPHASIQDHFFEIVVRYSNFFDNRPNELMQALGAFIDTRGLHNKTASVQYRCWYLFSRFIKALGAKLGDVGRQVLEAMQDLLVIELPEDSNDSDSDLGLSKTGPFEHRLNLFEAVGSLVANKSVAESEQAQLGLAVLEPLFNNIEACVSKAVPGDAAVLFLQRNIMAIGNFAAGFPSDTRGVCKPAACWHPLFEKATGYIMAAFDAQLGSAPVRDATRFAFARLVNLQEQRMAVELPRLIAGMVESSDTTQLAEFMPFLGQLVFKLRPSVFPVLDEALSPLLNKLFTLLNVSVQGTDDAVELMELRKAYLGFVNSIFTNGLESIFISEKNQPAFDAFLNSIIHYASDTSDPSTQKVAFGVLAQMVRAWCLFTLPPEPVRPGQRDPAGNGESKVSAEQVRTPLPGFEDYVKNTLVPLCFEVPSKSSFDLRDAQSSQVLGEIAALIKQIARQLGTDVILQSLVQAGVPQQAADELGTAMKELEPKRFKTLFRQFMIQMTSS